MTPLFGFINSPQEWIVLLVLGVLLFGKRLPEMGRYLGKGMVEFKKGLKGVEDDVEGTASPAASPAKQELDQPRPPQRVSTSVPKFEDVPATNSAPTSQPPAA